MSCLAHPELIRKGSPSISVRFGELPHLPQDDRFWGRSEANVRTGGSGSRLRQAQRLQAHLPGAGSTVLVSSNYRRLKNAGAAFLSG